LRADFIALLLMEVSAWCHGLIIELLIFESLLLLGIQVQDNVGGSLVEDILMVRLAIVDALIGSTYWAKRPEVRSVFFKLLRFARACSSTKRGNWVRGRRSQRSERQTVSHLHMPVARALFSMSIDQVAVLRPLGYCTFM
jgi:hypothetical protein